MPFRAETARGTAWDPPDARSRRACRRRDSVPSLPGVGRAVRRTRRQRQIPTRYSDAVRDEAKLVPSSAGRIEGNGIAAGGKHRIAGGRLADGEAGRGLSQIAVPDQRDRRCVGRGDDQIAGGRIGMRIADREQVPCPVAAPVTSKTIPALRFASTSNAPASGVGSSAALACRNFNAPKPDDAAPAPITTHPPAPPRRKPADSCWRRSRSSCRSGLDIACSPTTTRSRCR